MSARFILGTTVSVFAIAVMAAPASAQTSGPPAAQTTDDSEIVVTGSRIARRDFVATSPIVTVGVGELERTPAITLEAVLNQLPQFAGSYGQADSFPNVAGQTHLNLRGLGTNRALVLLNGRRIQASRPDGTIDINAIPTNLVANIETITGGASAVYGSDAMSGVVNFILKRDFSGVEIDAQYGGATEGDTHTESLSLLLGGNFDGRRGNAVLSLSYASRNQLQAMHREFTASALPLNRLPYALANLTANPPTQAALDNVFSLYGVSTGTVRRAEIGFNPDATLFAVQGNAPVVNYRGPIDEQFGIVNNAVVSYVGRFRDIQIPLERYNVYAQANYRLTDSIEAYGHGFFTSYQALTTVSPLSLGTLGKVGVVPATNPFIPTELAAILASRSNPGGTFPITYSFDQLPSWGLDAHNTSYQVLAGFRGSAPVRDWTWDVYFTTGRTDTSVVTINQLSFPAVQSLLSAPDGGASLCAGGFNPWGPPENLSQACRDFIGRAPRTLSSFEQDVAEATLQGGLLQLPAGEVRFAAGASYRRESYSFRPDDSYVRGEILNEFISLPSGGSRDIVEGFGELLIPVLSNLPLVQELNLGVAYRYSDYSTSSGVSTYRADLDWVMSDWLRLRGGYARAIRAPSLGELYTQAATSTIQIGTPSPTASGGDPCDIRGRERNGPNAAQVRALCLAQGVPGAAIDSYIFTSTSIHAGTAGNPNLTSETADTYSIGLVFHPSFDTPWLSQLQIALDYYDIAISDAIGALPFLAGVERCFNVDGVSNTSYDPNNIYCVVIARNQVGSIAQGQIPTLNLADYQTRGVDLQVNWQADIENLGFGSGNLGTIGVRFIGSYLDTHDLQVLPGAPVLDYAGYTSSPLSLAVLPEWRSTLTTTYAIGPLELGVTWRYIGGTDDVTRLTSPTSTVQSVKPYDYFDVFANWDVNEQLRVRFGLNNVADKGPPRVGTGQGSTDYHTYDMIGRSFFVGLRARF